MDDQKTDRASGNDISRRLGLSVPLVIFGVLGLAAVFRFTELLGFGSFLVWIVSGMLIGGGVFNMFDRLELGLIIGFIVQIGLLALLFSQPHIVG